MELSDNERNVLVALKSIEHVKGAHSLRSFRHKIFLRSKLSYLDSFIALNKLKDRNIIVRDINSRYKYINTKAKKHKNFNEFIASIADSDFITEELRAELKNIGVQAKSNYLFLKELIEQILYKERSCKLKNLYFNHRDICIFLDKFPSFRYNSLKNSAYKRVSIVNLKDEDKKAFDILSNKPALCLGYPFYVSKSNDLVPIFFIPININYLNNNEYSLSTNDDFCFLNSKFIEELYIAEDRLKIKNFLNIFKNIISKQDLEDDKLSENLALNIKEYPLDNLLRYISINFDSDCQLHFNPQKLTLKEDLKSAGSFLDCAIIFAASQKSAYIESLNRIQLFDDKILNRSSLRVFSNEINIDYDEDDCCVGNLVIGEDVSRINPNDSALRPILYSALANCNSLCIVKADLDLKDIINKILLNFALSEGLFSYAFNNELYVYKGSFLSKDNLNLLISERKLEIFSAWKKFIDYQKSQLESYLSVFSKNFIHAIKNASDNDIGKMSADLKRFIFVLDRHEYKPDLLTSFSLGFAKLYLMSAIRSVIFNGKDNDMESLRKKSSLIYGYLYLELAKRQILSEELLSKCHIKNEDDKEYALKLANAQKALNIFLDKDFADIYKLENRLFDNEIFSKSLIFLDKNFSLAKLITIMSHSKQVICIAKSDLCEYKNNDLLPSTYELLDSLCLDDENSILKNDLTSSKPIDEQNLFDKFISLFKSLNFEISFKHDLNFFEISNQGRKLFLLLDFDLQDVQAYGSFTYMDKYFKAVNYSLSRINLCYLENNPEGYVNSLIEEFFID